MYCKSLRHNCEFSQASSDARNSPHTTAELKTQFWTIYRLASKYGCIYRCTAMSTQQWKPGRQDKAQHRTDCLILKETVWFWDMFVIETETRSQCVADVAKHSGTWALNNLAYTMLQTLRLSIFKTNVVECSHLDGSEAWPKFQHLGPCMSIWVLAADVFYRIQMRVSLGNTSRRYLHSIQKNSFWWQNGYVEVELS